jgi:hypothetical protein
LKCFCQVSKLRDLCSYSCQPLLENESKKFAARLTNSGSKKEFQARIKSRKKKTWKEKIQTAVRIRIETRLVKKFYFNTTNIMYVPWYIFKFLAWFWSTYIYVRPSPIIGLLEKIFLSLST